MWIYLLQCLSGLFDTAGDNLNFIMEQLHSIMPRAM